MKLWFPIWPSFCISSQKVFFLENENFLSFVSDDDKLESFKSLTRHQLIGRNDSKLKCNLAAFKNKERIEKEQLLRIKQVYN
jgi:hypothetical protein